MRYSHGAMAKPKKDKEKEQKTEDARSVLKVAFEAYQRGDSVQARSLAQEVLAGKVGRDDEKVAVELAKALQGEGAVIEANAAAVAKELVTRTLPPSKSYLFAGAVAFTYLTLVILAFVRYRHS